MNVKKHRLLTLSIAFLLVFSVLTACKGSGTTTVKETSKAETTASTKAPETTGTKEPGEVSLPLVEEPVTFTGFYVVDLAEDDMNKNEVWKELSRRTNIYFEWETVVQENANERYTLMLSSKMLPDIISVKTSTTYPGGHEQAVEDGVYYDLRPMLPEHAPLYWEVLSNNPEAMRDAVTDKGYIPAFYQILVELYRDMPGLIFGTYLRGDWLEDLNLPIPETYDDWYTTLKAFKEEKGAEFPLATFLGYNSTFLPGYGIAISPVSLNPVHQKFYPDKNNKMHFGGIEEGWAEYLQMLSKWYAEGLYDRDFTTRGVFDLPGRAQLIGTGKSGAIGIYSEWLGMFYANAVDESFKLVGAPMPSKKGGEKVLTAFTRSKYLYDPIAITTACEQPELILQLFNYMCTDEGSRLVNFGFEGEQYVIENGQVKLTEKTLNHDLGPLAYLESFTGNFAPFRLQFSENIVRQINSPEVMEYKDRFYDTTDPVYINYALTAEEGQRLATLMGDITTYVDEEYALAVMDESVAANWMDVQAAQIKSMGIDEALDIVQAAWDRYMARK